jgi:circadian clock protein KaiC
MHHEIARTRPAVVIVDPINAFVSGDNVLEVKSMLTRLIDYLKSNNITALFTSLTAGGEALERTDSAISSVIDTWLVLIATETDGERNRTLSILKSRGMPHSNQTREFLITTNGVELRDVYIGPSGVLTGSARDAQESAEERERIERSQEIARRKLELERRRAILEAQVTALRQEFEVQEAETLALIEREQQRETRASGDRAAMASIRRADRESGRTEEESR